MIQLFLHLALATECSEPVELHEVEAELDAAEQAYTDLDELGFRDRANQLTGILVPCVLDPLPRALIQRHHRVMALQLSMVGDEPGATAALHASRQIDAGLELPAALLPEVHPLRDAYASFTPTRRWRKVPKPRTGSLTFDGTASRARPRGRPTVVQLFDGRGESIATQYLAPRDPLPAYRAVPRKRNTLIALASGAAAGSLATYLGALATKNGMFRDSKDPSKTRGSLQAARTQANTLTVTSGLLLTAAVGAGSAALAIGER